MNKEVQHLAPENLMTPLYRGKVYQDQDASALLVGDAR